MKVERVTGHYAGGLGQLGRRLKLAFGVDDLRSLLPLSLGLSRHRRLNAMLGWAQMLRSGVLQPDRAYRALEALERNARTEPRSSTSFSTCRESLRANWKLPTMWWRSGRRGCDGCERAHAHHPRGRRCASNVASSSADALNIVDSKKFDLLVAASVCRIKTVMRSWKRWEESCRRLERGCRRLP
jgi:hypothetical protein